MLVTGCAFVPILSALVTVVSGTLTGPKRAYLISTNMDLVLKWEPPEGAPSGLTYSTEYRSSVTEFGRGCEKISTLKCDLTSFNISAYGKYTARVQAQLGDQKSAWALSNEITLDRETSIGSPRVSLFPIGDNLEVVIQDPVFRVSTLRSVYSSVVYNLAYWKKGQEKEPRNLTNVQQTRVVLNGLDPWSEYCVQVQIHTVKNPNPSHPSDIICESTAGEKKAPWVAALVVFVVMAAAVVLVVVVVLHWKRISQILCPKHALPEYFKATMLTTPRSSVYFPMQNSPPEEEINHQVHVVLSDGILKEDCPLESVESRTANELTITEENGLTVNQHMPEETL